MKALIFIIASIFLLQACDLSLNNPSVRAKTLNGSNLLTFDINPKEARIYQKGDTVTVQYRDLTLSHTWRILNTERRADTLYYSDAWYDSDSTYYRSYRFEFKNVIIEEIIK